MTHQLAYAAIKHERDRQVNQLGYTSDHDRQHATTDLLGAARVYLSPATHRTEWPWEPTALKLRTRIQDLTKSGALFLAAADLAQYREQQDFWDAAIKGANAAVAALSAELHEARKILERGL